MMRTVDRGGCPGAGGDRTFGDYSPGRYAWMTRNLRRLKPFPVTGRQGLFRVTLPVGLEDSA